MSWQRRRIDQKRRHFFVERLENRRLLAGDWAPTEVEGPAVHSVAVGVTDDGVPSRAASVPVVFSAGFIPEIDVVGNGHSIEEGDATPDLLDFTDFGTVGVDGELITRTYRIENIGTGTLNLTGSPRVAISGANAGDFTVTLQPPESIDAGDSRDFTVEFNPGAGGCAGQQPSRSGAMTTTNPLMSSTFTAPAAHAGSVRHESRRQISALDALAIINQINRTLTNQEQSSAENVDQSRYDYDANGDGKVSTLDALLVINHVRSGVDGGGNTVPVANDDAYTVENGQLQLTATDGVFAIDADAEGNRLTARVTSQPTKGELIFSSDGSFSYTAQQEGTDSSSYVAEDGQGESNVALVSIVVLPPPPPPTQETCLDQTGPLITLSGSQSALVDLDVEPQTKFDATSATWYATGNTRIELSGDNLCWHGGLVEHNWPADQGSGTQRTMTTLLS